MNKMSQGDLVIAIKDAPGVFNQNIKAYLKGDTFKVSRESIEDSSRLQLIILHPNFGEIYVTRENFQLLSEYRESILNSIIN